MAISIADKIKEWARTKVLNQSDLTRNTDAYNRVAAAIQDLVAQDWTQAPAPTESSRSESQRG